MARERLDEAHSDQPPRHLDLNFDRLTLDQYKKWANKELVVFLRKKARLNHMVDIDIAGLLCNAITMVPLDFKVPKLVFPGPLDDKSKFITVLKNSFEPKLMMYAMDRYGNLFQSEQPGTQEIRKEWGAEFSRYNHSTFNAGHKVICAGMIGINQGKLVWIYNASGHYRPTKNNLKEAVAILNEDVDLSETVVGVFFFNNQGAKIKCGYLQTGALLSDGKPFFIF